MATPKLAPQKSKSVKTTFKLTQQAIDDFNYLAEKLSYISRGEYRRLNTKKDILDIIMQNFFEGEYYFDEETFYSTTIKDIDYSDQSHFVRLTMTISEWILPELLRLQQEKKFHRDAILDSAIKTFRKFFDLSHPSLLQEISVINEFMQETYIKLKQIEKTNTLIKWRDALFYCKYPIIECWDKIYEATEKFHDISITALNPRKE